MRKAFTYDDVNIVPKYSETESRSDVNLITNFTKKTKITIPIVIEASATLNVYHL